MKELLVTEIRIICSLVRFRVWKWVARQVILSRKMSPTCIHHAIFKIKSISNLVYCSLNIKTNAF